MSEYVCTLDHFRLVKDGGTLSVTSWTADGFEQTYTWPEDLSVDDLSVSSELHDRFYLDIVSSYENYQS